MATPGARAVGADGLSSALPDALSAALAEFSRHLDAERALSRHTIRAYLGDVQSLLEYACRDGITGPGALDLTILRGWLASQHQAGAARATLARRGAAARAFTSFAYRQGWLAADPGPQLGTPKTRRALPQVLRREEIDAVLAECADRAMRDLAAGQRTQAALSMRDAAVLELLYATAIRVSELCDLDVGALDAGRRTVIAATGYYRFPGSAGPGSSPWCSRSLTVGAFANDFQWWGLRKGVRSSPVPARNPSRRAGRYCIRLSRVLTSAVSWPMSRLTRLASDRLRCAHVRSTGLSSCAYGGSRKTVSQSRAAISSAIAALTWVFRPSQMTTSGPPSCWRAASRSRA